MIKKITAGLMLPCIFISSVFGQKKNLETVVNNPTAYEENKNKSKDDEHGISIIYNYQNKEIGMNKIPYSLYESSYKRTLLTTDGYVGHIDSNIPDVDNTPIADIFNDIANKKINSYSEFIKRGKDLEDEDQKLIFINAYSNLLRMSGFSNEIIFLSQEENFSIITDSLRNDKHGSSGNCIPNSFSTERTGEDIGQKTIDVISEVGHECNIIDTEKGITIINYLKSIRLKNNYDVEELLKIYGQIVGRTTFQHGFFDKGKLKQILITENGKRFLEATKHENPKNFLEKTLVHQNRNRSPTMQIEINQNDYGNSVSNNIMGIFLRMGKIKGEENSAMRDMIVYQVGFNRDFLFEDKLNLHANSSYIGGQIKELRIIKDPENPSKKEYEITKFPIRGFMADLGLAYYDLYGINIGTKYSFLYLEGDQNYKNSYPELENGEPVLRYKSVNDYLVYKNEFGIGASYNLKIRNFNLKPYLIMNEGFCLDNIKDESLSKDFKDYLGKGLFSELGKVSPILMEYGGGISSEFEISPFKIGINPFCFIRQNEKEYGAKGNLKFNLDGKKFGLEGNFSDIKSNYIFNPNKRILGTGVYVQIGNLGIKVGHENETKSDIKNRWLEHEHNYNFNINYNF